ncbi:probable LRR receptor-like serine/threonine-protein kinase At1g67720 [Cucurbita pepo subsp. pepo]|uniref:probable LRR receptor-like serine/threonine-protein kinase At1g67720 n=1 Tax=Cucurbita pepo subsp. pepo TaxID=3664 RepID=UPI000C9D31D8|nr:probable LRR receptor-like serine/threonine-protein kinase At1g67720 [Cucurbita pepo subsp. pepo]XP_023541670.1 probable LRR receptor-like serine/threonine-protein kinase At1g67720 [Cucurbita pepo subsp. pepo]XP_023541671.1 probable LRR receptor-like serine/threonine-protein kinase At1g67720 [Cucurbita pepo subsp. pepo]
MQISDKNQWVLFIFFDLQMGFPRFLVLILLVVSSVDCQVKEFISIDCGGSKNYTDPVTGLAWISDAGVMAAGGSSPVENPHGNLMQYGTRRDFPIDDKKYCYTLETEERRRYLVRATFQYGSLKNEETYPKFELYLDATKWSTVTIFDASRVYVKEMIIRAPSSSFDVCICCATTGYPFISTLELRPFNLSMYATDFEDDFFLEVAARVNFGALSKDVIRYPDDPYDRIWDSDLEKRQNYLVGVAPGTERISTMNNINVMTREYPPVKVMQTAVLGTKGVLSYRLNLDDFPANARAYAYFAEIEELGQNETRKFKLEEPNIPDSSNAVVNIAENANGTYTLYEPSYMNVSLSFVLSFSFVKTRDSTRGPLLNALEISRYVEINAKTDGRDEAVVNALRTMSAESVQTNQGDPCVPTSWEWVTCTATKPPRISKIELSRKNVKGDIPPEINTMDGLTELWLDGNFLAGSLPDMSNLVNLKILHLENNKLTGTLPSYLGTLPNLQELYIQNNAFSGEIPSELLAKKLVFKYDGNLGLHASKRYNMHSKVIIGVSLGVLVLLILLLVGSFLLLHKLRRRTTPYHKKGGSLKASTKRSSGYSIGKGDEGIAYYLSLAELEEATNNFSKKVGKGSFGSVYYGKMADGKEVAVKIMAESSAHGNQQFTTEVALLSRIHHRNLVPLIGYCEEEHQRILVYEYMHNGTLRDHLYGSTEPKHLDWLPRLRIAEDAAKGLEYLHTGCSPSIIHRDVKTSNILLDINMRAKVSDFGLSRQAEEDLTHVSSVARGTVGYLDPEYYASQQLTEKSDVYSFGVVLLELISGKKPVSPEDYGSELNIVHWARSLVHKGDVTSIIDPFLNGKVKIESVWRIAEVAIQCVQQHGVSRPRMQEVIVAIQDAIKIEQGIEGNQKLSSSSSRTQSCRKTLLTTFLEIESPDGSLLPSAR